MSGRIAVMAMLTALAMIFSYIETVIPFFPAIPGFKLGLANIVVLSGLYIIPPRDIFIVSMIRIILMGILFYNGAMLLYSLCGGVLSFVVMYCMKICRAFTLPGISAAGAVAHNIGQIIAAFLIIRNVSIFAYLPVLIILGVIMGVIVGIISMKVIRIWTNKE